MPALPSFDVINRPRCLARASCAFRLLSCLALLLPLSLAGCGTSRTETQTDPPAKTENPAPAPEQQAASTPPSEATADQPVDNAPLWPSDRAQSPPPTDRSTFIPLEPAPTDNADQPPPTSSDEPENPLRSKSAGNSTFPRRIAETPPADDSRPSTLPLATLPETSPSGTSAPEAPPAENAVAAEAPAELSPSAPPKKREPLFEGWQKPLFALVLTGQQHGYIEPCGCTGLANQKGGLARRHTLLKDLRETRGWDVVPLDVGNQVRRSGTQAEIKFARTADGLRAMNYGAITLGNDDLRLPASALLAATNPDENESIFLSSNVALLARDFQPATRVIQAGGKKIGVTAVLGPAYEQKLTDHDVQDVTHEAPLKALKAAAAALQKQKCDYYVLLSHASLDETKSLAKEVPIFDIVVTSGGFGEPTLDLEQINGTKSLLAQVGTKGMYTGVVGFFGDKQDPIRYQRVPLDDRFEDSPEMLQLLADYQQQLQQTGLEELGVRPQRHPSGHQFVGSDTCGQCHTKAFAVWSGTPHAHATDSLVKPPARGDIARHYDPECLSCHVTGWEPQKFYPFESGYLSLEETPHLQHNGCENCHGPGSAHVAAENGEGNPSAATIAERRNEMKLPLAGGVAERKCMECHDLDNSPDFHLDGAFEKYWKQVEHKGKD